MTEIIRVTYTPVTSSSNDVVATNSLQAFIQEIEALKDKKIVGFCANNLIEKAQEIIESLSALL